MKDSIERAFLDFDEGIRPEGYKEPKCWYVLNSKGKFYPAKAIWALATDDEHGGFHTKDARIGFSELKYSLVDTSTITSDDFDEAISQSLSDSPQKRRARLKSAPKKPIKVPKIIYSFQRNPDVVAEALELANGICGQCNSKAPFVKKSNGKPYLEVHHIKQLAHGGEDSIENAIALCPNCHREQHYG